MIYKVFLGYDTGGKPIYRWKCNCVKCQTTAAPCRHIIEVIEQEKEEKK